MNRDLSSTEWEQLTELQYPIDHEPEGLDAAEAEATPALKQAVEDMLRLQKQFDQSLVRVTVTAKQHGDNWRMDTKWE